MKKIKRTIRIRKVEFISNKKHELNVEVCPLCHSPILPPNEDSAVEISAVESPLQLERKHGMDEEN